MTVSTTTSRIEFAGNGSTVAFATGFYVIAAADLDVYLRDNTTGLATLQTKDVDYTVTLVGETNATVTFTTAPATGKTVVLVREPDAKQETDYVANDPFPAESHEKALDLLTMLVQALKDKTGRAVRIADGATTGFDGQFTPTPGLLLAVDSLGSGMDTQTFSDMVDAAAAAAASTSAVTGFVGAQHSTSPNNTVNASSLSAAGDSSSVDAVIKPKGYGAFQLNVADGAFSGGNKRGRYAVDLQLKRTSPAQVASGEGSGIGAGGNNKTASGVTAGVGEGGTGNTASGGASGVGPGGAGNIASGDYAGIGQGGIESRATATFSGVAPGSNFALAERVGEFVHSGPNSTTVRGSAQTGDMTFSEVTYSTDQVELGISYSAYFTLPRNNEAFILDITYLGISTVGYGYGQSRYVAYRDNSGTVTVSFVAFILGWDPGTLGGSPTWSTAADNTNKRIAIKVTPGDATKTHWMANIRYTKVGAA